MYLSIKFHRYIAIYRFLRYIENFWNFSKFYEIFDILIFNISRYIANLTYQNISFCDISQYIAIYRPIYRYIAIYRVKNVIFAVTFCKFVDFWGPRPRKFFPQNFDKKTSTHQKFRSGPSPSTFYGLFSKKRFSDFHFFSYFFLGNYNQILFIFHKKSTFQRFSGEITKEIWKIKISKTLFRK